MRIRLATEKDIYFMKEMLFEAVFWRSKVKPDFEESLQLDGIREAIENFGRSGDIGFLAEVMI